MGWESFDVVTRQRPTSRKNGRMMMACYLNTVGEPLSEIPYAAYLFSLAAYIYIHAFYCKERNLIFYMDIIVIGY